jgi:hypothetical protein
MLPIILLLRLILRLIGKLIELALIYATYPSSFWIAVATLVIGLFTAATTGGILLWKKWHERHLDLEFRMMKTPRKSMKPMIKNLSRRHHLGGIGLS